MDIIITAVFTVDIFLNFFVAIEDTNNEYEYSNRLIAKAYLSNSFGIEVVATEPFEYLFNFIAFSTNIIKSIRILKIFKLIKILRVSK